MANIIQQFKNVNGDNIFPLAYAQGGMKMDLLWTNPSPTSDFAAQTVPLDLSEYSMLIIVTEVTSLWAASYCFPKILNKAFALHFVTENNSNSRIRAVTFTSSGVEFGNGMNNGSTNNAEQKPKYIYGIKMSYIVPTSVHGLQYVEV